MPLKCLLINFFIHNFPQKKTCITGLEDTGKITKNDRNDFSPS